MPSFSWNGLRALVVIICGLVTTVLWILCIWQLVLRFKPDTSSPSSPPFICKNNAVYQNGSCLCPEEWIGQFCETETSSPLPFCKNNGDCRNGSCLCPQEWRGPFCEKANFCNNSTYSNSSTQNVSENLTFTIIVVDRYGYSEEKCEDSTANAGTPKGRRKCLDIKGTPTLDAVQVVNCNANLNSLMKQLNTSDNTTEIIQAIANNTQFLTSEPEKLTADNITSAAVIAQRILEDYSEAAAVASAAVATVSQLLSANNSEFKRENNNLVNTTARLTKTLEEFSLGHNGVEPHIAIQNITLTNLISNTTTTRFIARTGLGSLNSKDIQVEENVSGFVNVNNTEVEIQISVTTNDSSGNGSIGFVLYQNDKFFQSEKYKSRFNHTKHIISSHVANATVNDVKIAFKPWYKPSEIQLHDYACVFWDYDQNDWNTAGCTKERNNLTLGCRCNHSSSFAILMSFRINYTYAQPLEIVSYTGSGFSIAGLVITILFQIVTRKTRKLSVTWMLVSLCTSMLIFNIIFITGIENPNAKKNGSDVSAKDINSVPKSDRIEPSENTWCTAVAVLLHYFLLATFVWTALNAAYLYMLLLKTLKPLPEHLTLIMSVIGWGAPAVVVAVTLGSTYQEGNQLKYRQEEFCWLAALDEDRNMSPEKPMFWAFFLFVAVILLFDIIIFVKITISVMWTENKDLTSNKKKSLKNKIFGTLSIAVVLGVTWILGFLMLIEHEQTNTAFRFLFCIFNATQPKKHPSGIFKVSEKFSEETSFYSNNYLSEELK